MSLEAELPGQSNTQEGWQMVCCRYYTAGRRVDGKRVLEVGCGAGMGLGYLAGKARRVVGGDYSPDNIERSRAHYGNRVELLVLDGQRLPFRDNSFDVVMAMEVIYYFTSPDSFFTECQRVLEKDGLLCFCLPNKDLPGFHASPLSHRYYTGQELAEMLKGHHFSPEIFGAFPISRGSFYQSIRSAALVTAGRILDIIPGGRAVKEFLRKIIYGQLMINKAEIEESDMESEYYHMEPVAPDSPDRKHQIIYVLAHATQ
jgi:SAM-dependent methyltransferase